MALKSTILTLPSLWNYVTALPAGAGFSLNDIPHRVNNARAAAYSLIDTYNATNWVSKFDVQAISDPTHGFVEYVNLQTAQSSGLLKTQNNQVYMGVDYQTTLSTSAQGRKSTRIQSKTAYNKALVIADFAHVPASACGSWPAFWMLGPNWPNQGEIDIYEGIHLNTNNQMTLHTSPGCTPTVGSGGETGSRPSNTDCGAGGGYNGCSVISESSTSFGNGVNSKGGGVYATLWTSSGIKVWYFPSSSVPTNIRTGTPDPATWGTPAANFAGCDFNSKFSNLNLIFDITFCGDWAGSVWSQSTCSQLNSNCNAYVAANPSAFKDTYWLVNSVKVYSV